jgi:hypothetical protein
MKMTMFKSGSRLRGCVICGDPVLARPYQSNSARACSPSCAKVLAVREHPDLLSKSNRAVPDEEKPS